MKNALKWTIFAAFVVLNTLNVTAQSKITEANDIAFGGSDEELLSMSNRIETDKSSTVRSTFKIGDEATNNVLFFSTPNKIGDNISLKIRSTFLLPPESHDDEVSVAFFNPTPRKSSVLQRASRVVQVFLQAKRRGVGFYVFF